MAKIQLMAVVSIDGCLSDFGTEGQFWIAPDTYGMDEIYERATHTLKPGFPLRKLEELHKMDDSDIYLMTANSDDNREMEFIHSLMKRKLIDEMYLYIVPVITGTGKRLFKEQKVSNWKQQSMACYPDGVCRIIYKRINKLHEVNNG